MLPFEANPSVRYRRVRDQMKAIAIVPGRPETAGVFDMPEPPKSDGSVLVRTLSVGLCGTDLEIALGGYGVPPPGEERLVLGHESIGEVIDAPKGSGLEPGNLVVGIVRRPDPYPAQPVRPTNGICAETGASLKEESKNFTAMGAHDFASIHVSPCELTQNWVTSAFCSSPRQW